MLEYYDATSIRSKLMRAVGKRLRTRWGSNKAYVDILMSQYKFKRLCHEFSTPRHYLNGCCSYNYCRHSS